MKAKNIFQIFNATSSVDRIVESVDEKGFQVFTITNAYSQLKYINKNKSSINLANEYAAHTSNIETSLRRRVKNSSELRIQSPIEHA